MTIATRNKTQKGYGPLTKRPAPTGRGVHVGDEWTNVNGDIAKITATGAPGSQVNEWAEIFHATLKPHQRALFVDGTTDVPLADQTGSYATPFASIQQALNAVTREGTIIYVEAGRQTNVASASWHVTMASLAAGATLFVESVDGFPAAGSILVSSSIGSTQQPSQLLNYTGLQQSPPAFLGVSGGVGATSLVDNFLPVTGTYKENLSLPNFDRMSLVGSGPGVIVVNNGPGDTLAWVRTNDPFLPQINQFRCEQFTFYNISPNVADACIRFDGFAETGTSAGYFMMQEASFNYVQTVRLPSTPAATNVWLRRCNRVTFRACPLVRGFVIVNNCSLVIFDQRSAMDRLDLVWDSTLAVPVQGRSSGYVLANGSLVSGTVNLSGHPAFSGSPDTRVGSIIGALLTIGTNAPISASARAPSIVFQGEIAANVEPFVLLPLPTNAVIASTVDFSGARFKDVFIAAPNVIDVTTAGPNVQPITARGARFELFLTTIGTPPAAVRMGANTSWDVRGSWYSGMAMFDAAGPGTLDRDSWALYGKLNVAGAVVITPAFPAGVTAYVVTGSPDTPGSDVAITVKTNAGFTSTPSVAAGNVDFLISRSAA